MYLLSGTLILCSPYRVNILLVENPLDLEHQKSDDDSVSEDQCMCQPVTLFKYIKPTFRKKKNGRSKIQALSFCHICNKFQHSVI